MRAARAALVALVALAAGGCPLPAGAYQVQHSDEGLPLRWQPGEVLYHLDPQGGWPVPEADLAAAVDAAFAAWAASPDLGLDLARGAAAPGGFGYTPMATNSSVVRYEGAAWDYDPAALMLTFVQYRIADGAIVDADILINGVDHRWRAAGAAAEDSEETFDLQNSLTHEAGHFLGLAHSADHPEAAMFPSTTHDELSKRDLAADDTDGIAYLYVTEALPPVETGGMGCSSGGRANGAGLALAALAVLLALATAGWRRRASTVGFVLLAVGVTGLSAAPAMATALQYRSIDELVASADVVAHGRVTTRRAHRVGRLIVTDMTVQVIRCMRGACGPTLVVRQPGGEVGAYGLRVEGAFLGLPGQEVVLFLRRGRDDALAPVGMCQGAFRVDRRRARAPVAVRELHGVTVAPRGQTLPAPRQEVRLESLLGQVNTRGKERAR